MIQIPAESRLTARPDPNPEETTDRKVKSTPIVRTYKVARYCAACEKCRQSPFKVTGLPAKRGEFPSS